MSKKKTTDSMTRVETWFLALPALPKSAKEGLVTITPWVALVFGILGILGGIAGFGVLTTIASFTMAGLGSGFSTLAMTILGVISSAFLLAAFPGTNVHKLSGWNLLFWSEVVSLLSVIIAFSISGIILSLIMFYLLFQIKAYYK